MALLKKLNLAPAKADMVKQSSESIPSEIDKVIVVLSEAEREEYEERAAIYHRLKKKRKWYLRQEIESAFYQSEVFQERLHNTLKAYFCKKCGGRREGYEFTNDEASYGRAVQSKF